VTAPRARTPPRDLRFALVGAGTALHAMYGPAFRFLEGARLVAVMDPWDEARARAEDYRGVVAYASLDALIEKERPDAAIVAGPTPFHAEQTVRLARAGVHVFCEKPMARDLAECDRMIAACRAAGVLLGIGFMKRYNKAVRVASEWAHKGRLGKLFALDAEWNFPAGHDHGVYAHPHRPWRGRRDNWGGVFQDHGSHTIDLARLWLGEPTWVAARMGIAGKGGEVEDVAVAIVGHAGGATSTHRMNIRTHKPLMERYDLYGTRGTLELDWGGTWRWSAYTAEPMNVRVHRKGVEVQDLTPRPEQAIDHEISRHWHYLAELRDFVAAIRNGTPAPVPGEDGRAVVEAIVAAYHAAATGRAVALPLSEPVDVGAIFATGALARK
jgi:myo-inositol 2-dehydrogenase/D-chiro-inositol 1-dehydrogenase